MRKIAQFLLFANIMISIPAVLQAQARVVTAEYPVAKSTMDSARRQAGERSCTYFFSTSILGDPRVSFTYTLPGGKTESEMPLVQNLKIRIDESKTTPTVQEIGRDDHNRPQYMLRMNSTTAGQEGPCLVGIPR
jgi:hypothetical protein